MTTPMKSDVVRGTQFVLKAASEHTELLVTEGKTKFTRNANGGTVIVTKGKRSGGSK